MKLTKNDKYTVESVLMGHPDKICDRISDTLLDEYLLKDPHSHTAIECLGTGKNFFIAGEVFSKAEVDVEKIALDTYKSIGYNEQLNIHNLLSIQSKQLNQGLEAGCSGDQGIMYGYAIDSPKTNYLPYGVYIVSKIAQEIDNYRVKSGKFMPDGKVQVTICNGKVDTLIISVQQHKNQIRENLKLDIVKNVLEGCIDVNEINQFYFNHKSDFINGGFINDTGLTGRKIIVDTYGGLCPHGGGAFSGKDPTKMDRTGAYMARYVAKHIVKNQMAKECQVALGYAFGVENPVMLELKLDNKSNEKCVLEYIKSNFDFRPNAIIERLNLRNFRYSQVSNYGHFLFQGSPWENI